MSDENLTALLAKRAPKPRAKSTTALIWIVYLNVFLESMRCRRPLHQSMSNSAA